MHNTEDIRNLALMGQDGAGKTTLAEKLLFQAGVINSPGSVEKGNTVSDYEPEELQYHHSLHTSVLGLDYKGIHINLLDTPGNPDFIGQTLSAAPAVDALAIVINAQNGIEPMTRRLMNWSKAHNYCRMIIVNKIDGMGHKLESLLDDIRDTFSSECIPINAPTKDGSAVVDCFFNGTGDTAFSTATEMHTALIDQVVEMDDELMESYLENASLESGQLHDAFEKALREGHLIPVCFVSARNDVGIDELLQIFCQLMPNPVEGTAHKFMHTTDTETDKWFAPKATPDQNALGHVFQVTFDPFVGKMGVFRIHQGTVTKDTNLFIDNVKKSFKVTHLFKMQGKQHIETDRGIPGDICAVAKVDELHFNAILHETHDADDLQSNNIDLPPPMSRLAIDAKKRGDEQKVADALEKITLEDPCLQVEHNNNTHETVLKGMGELHLRIALSKMSDVYHVDTKTRAPKIDYRETITSFSEGHFRHKKQSGGAGQFGEVFLRMEPLARGKGFEFVNAVVGGAIPGQFIPAVEKGVRQAMLQGPLAGCAIQDIKVAVCDGKHHSVDSNEISFVTAARKAFYDAFEKANPIILEPIVTLEITAPQINMGDLSGDLASRRARISDTRNNSDGKIIIIAQVPLAELNDYSSRLKALTGGEGEFMMTPFAFDQTTPETQNRLSKEYQ